ncbi:MAG: bifunctional DNA-formamidopyrimidine glycosylase/DNA-(apurinic or apyrimidinic site) lyase [Pseudomonadota bacterium]|jgi:formamidopyrimidine-DNA glycosylase|uniref:Formamidopyrimidine-DNA glycosylase n=1 Tax=Candidatus Fonsibacter lacus TaxID=2576439 RepID=A0A845S9S0_9PROT|nr:bifunctional DNA-formamidopyrimidine glycosylase/DNA-(apurinic or apyrimidinic site) lyase [Candidatus Fonsibacter lacus]NBP59514.1 bifunctional DNA-formamidopyrimidine glycosylase/DNA-(apurinic or apyrimidinic site) lyase [Pseudomonadota bacterium]NBO62418.1 bifunctional DNA-formamidopyrimidine glycosylase/DNA-(apurinic or apyrimidinic site) lyase [Candidatus Fonsibacter lacus]NBP99814.1 bifunctional DNA-formamidopyrimidine glycosylase/DNA-(apurinic or apyrimidinic site) lyase [Pseudomonadot
MPELPEVEVTRRTLLKFIENKVIKNIKINNPNLRFKIPTNFKKNVIGQKIIKVLRRSKYILIYLKNDYVMIAHLGMSGKFLIKNNYSKDFLKTSYYFNEFSLKHNHIEFFFSNNLKVIYNDPRRFGFFLLDKVSKLDLNKFLNKLGPEPLGNDLKKDYLMSKTKATQRSIKTLLMDQHFISGIGNIYANEILFSAKIKPNKISSKLTLVDIERLHSSIGKVLKRALKLGGSSIKDFKSSVGLKGRFQNEFKVYDRRDLKCLRSGCSGLIARVVSQGRASFFCNECQN